MEKNEWQTSKAGNKWKRLGDLTLTVFQRTKTGRYAWCIATREGPEYSPTDWQSEREATRALRREVARWDVCLVEQV